MCDPLFVIDVITMKEIKSYKSTDDNGTFHTSIETANDTIINYGAPNLHELR